MILYFNADKEIKTAINSITKSKAKEPTSIFIEWINTKKGTSLEKADALLKQTEILEKYVKKLPIVIFDRYRSMTNEEYNWLKKFKVTFFEPALRHREGFNYLPHWTKIKTMDDIKIDDHKRSVNVGYIGPLFDKIKSYEKYYVKIKMLNDVTVSYFDPNLSEDKAHEYNDLGIIHQNDFHDIEFTVIIGNAMDYVIGHLDQYYLKALECNCIPVIPMEHRYYCGLSLIADSSYWYDMYDKMYENTYIGFIKDAYDRICKYYPEMDIKYAAETFKKYLGEK